MADRVLEMQATIRRNTEDLREELEELARWEDEMKSKSGAKKKSSTSAAIISQQELPPIRGTAPLVKPNVPPKEDPAVKYKDDGNEYFKRNQFEDALRSYTRGIDLDPHSSSSHVLYANRAMCHLKLQNWVAAEADATVCVGMNRSYFKAFFRRALARKALGKLEEAIADLQTVAVLSPGDADSQRELKLLNEALKVKREAEAAASQAAAKPGAQGKKKLVIEEVDDDDDVESPATTSSAAETERKQRQAAEAAKAEAEALRKRQDEEAKEKARQAQVAAQAAAIAAEKERKQKEHEKAVEAAKKTVRANPKIEEIEEDSPKKAHRDPTKSAEATTAKASTTAARPRVVPVARTSSLPEPKSFTDIEKVFSEVGHDDEVYSDWVRKKLDVARLPALVGIGMSTEILVSLLKVAKRAAGSDPAYAASLVTSLSKVQRLGEVVMFLEDAESRVLQEVLAAVDVTSEVKQRFR